jgi:hypothetical protein
MVAAAEIQLGEEASPLELVQQLVDAESPCLVLLTHKQHRHEEGGRAGPDDALAQHVIALFLDLVLEQLRVAVRPNGDRWRRRQKVDAVEGGPSAR